MKRFELVDISADAGIAAFGGNVRELFENAAAGMYSLITNVESVHERKTIDVAIERDSLEGLLVAWLNELIFRFDVDGFIAKKIVITGLSIPPEEAGKPLAVRASLSGEEFDPARHEGKLLLKAATYHNLRIEKTGDIWRSEIIFDV
jgi:SHS2 domain-containing protein